MQQKTEKNIFVDIFHLLMEKTIFLRHEKKTPNKIRFIVILMIVVWIAMIFSQLDFLQLNIDNQKSLFETKVETALHRATTDINFKTFEQLQLENPELKNEKMNFSDTTSIYVEFANELQIEKWDKFTVNDFINLHNMVKAMNINFDYLNLGFLPSTPSLKTVSTRKTYIIPAKSAFIRMAAKIHLRFVGSISHQP